MGGGGDFLHPPLNASWKTLISDVQGFFCPTVNYTPSGYTLNADRHLMD